MINDIKKAYKIVKYSPQFKNMMLLGMMFGILGFVFEVSEGGESVIGAFYFVLLPVFLFQLLMTLTCSKLVQASPLKKKLQVTMPYLVTVPLEALFTGIIIVYHVYLVNRGVEGLTYEENYARQSAFIFVVGIIVSFSFVYYSLCYKYMIVPTILFVVIMVFILGVVRKIDSPVYTFLSRNLTVSVVATVGMFVVSVIVSYIITLLTYKHNLSPFITKRMLVK
ncbi:MAG: hypothetical protein K6G06_03305 [Butyrivibrio sp.]|nr:hypothetical protein [Butyrivibrio sp.]